MITRLTGIMLIAAAIAVTTFQQAPVAAAEGVAVTATVNAVKSLTLSVTTLALAGGNPGATVNATPATCADVVTNTTDTWTLAIQPATTYFRNTNSTDMTWFPTSQLQWRTGTASYAALNASTAQTVTTGTSSRNVCLDFQLLYPSTGSPGTYNTVINITLT